MKKKILTLVLTAAMLSACGNSREEVKNTVDGYWQKITDGSFDELKNFTDADSNDDFYKEPIRYFDDYVNGLILSLSGIVDEDEIKSVLNSSMGIVLEKIEYTIDEVSRDGEDYRVKVSANMPDTDLSFSDGLDMLYKVCGVSDNRELLQKFLESKGLKAEEALASYNGSSKLMEQDFAKWVIDNYLAEFINQTAENMNMIQKSWDFVLENDDGSWLIDNIKEN